MNTQYTASPEAQTLGYEPQQLYAAFNAFISDHLDPSLPGASVSYGNDFGARAPCLAPSLSSIPSNSHGGLQEHQSPHNVPASTSSSRLDADIRATLASLPTPSTLISAAHPGEQELWTLPGIVRYSYLEEIEAAQRPTAPFASSTTSSSWSPPSSQSSTPPITNCHAPIAGRPTFRSPEVTRHAAQPKAKSRRPRRRIPGSGKMDASSTIIDAIDSDDFGQTLTALAEKYCRCLKGPGKKPARHAKTCPNMPAWLKNASSEVLKCEICQQDIPAARKDNLKKHMNAVHHRMSLNAV